MMIQLKIVVALFLLTPFLLTGCSTAQLMPISGPGVQVDPSGKVATIHGDVLTVRAGQIETPYRLDRKLTTVRMTIINPTDAPIEFMPKEIVLFDQDGTQYFPLTPDALIEAAESGARPRTFVTYGLGYSRGYPYGHYWNTHWYYAPFSTTTVQPSYQGLIAKALPIRPVTIHPESNITGNVYFPIAAKYMTNARVRLTRFLESPGPDNPNPPQEAYDFEFNVIEN
ncbi:MAG: hypothetical protein P9L94_04980 [Candidatus Hinthialibacter antarcticus]|nr:hypothetical protein [Candidatus Hinthialibacter antarcticus]